MAKGRSFEPTGPPTQGPSGKVRFFRDTSFGYCDFSFFRLTMRTRNTHLTRRSGVHWKLQIRENARSRLLQGFPLSLSLSFLSSLFPVLSQFSLPFLRSSLSHRRPTTSSWKGSGNTESKMACSHSKSAASSLPPMRRRG